MFFIIKGLQVLVLVFSGKNKENLLEEGSERYCIMELFFFVNRNSFFFHPLFLRLGITGILLFVLKLA
jgi:hypothetical protein